MKAKRLSDGKTIDVYAKSIEHYYDAETNDYYRPNAIEVIAPEKETVEGWVARDKDTSHGCDLHLFTKVKPERRELMADWVGGLSRIVLDSSLFPSITWESEPRKARIEITLIDEKEE